MEVKLKKPNMKIPKLDFSKVNLSQLSLRGNLFKIARKELASFFASPLGFIIMGLFIIIVCIIFFGVFQFLKYGTSDITQLFTAIAFSFVIIIPALTMGSISRERQSGTLEFILTQPVSELQFVLGKALAYAILLAFMLLLTLPLTFAIGLMAPLDSGQILMQYFGAFIFGSSLISIGIAVSSIFKSEITALLVSLLVSVLFMITGSQFLNLIPLELQAVVDKFSLLTHYQSVSRGVLDLRDVLYFIAFILSFLGIAYFMVVKDKFPKGDRYLKNSQIALAILIVIAVIIGYIGIRIPGRIDFTSSQKYTLAEASKNILSKLNDVVTITLFASSNLPVEFQSDLREVEDILRDYNIASGGKVNIVRKDPQVDPVAITDAQQAGLQEIIFAVDTNDSSQRIAGYFGLKFDFLDKSEAINLSTQDIVRNIEYELTKTIKKLAQINRSKVAVLSSNVKQSRTGTYVTFNSELTDLFEVVDLELTAENSKIPEDIKGIVIPGPNVAFDDAAKTALRNYFNEGGAIFLLDDSIDVSSESQEALPNEGSFRDFFADIGVTIGKDLVYDLQNNNYVSVGSGLLQFPIEYPLWTITSTTEAGKSVLRNINGVPILWGSSLTIDKEKIGDNQVIELFRTSAQSNIQTEQLINITVDNVFNAKDDDSSRLLAAAIENAKGGRAIIISDSDLLSDEILSGLQGRTDQYAQALAFGTASVEWITKDESISSIKARSQSATKFSPDSRQTFYLIAGGIAVPTLTLLMAGLVKIYIRKRDEGMEYEYN